MLNKELYGYYEFNNQTIINISNNANEMNYTELHEYIHLVLTQKTTFGAATIMLSHANTLDSSMQWLKSELINLMKAVQEGVATFAELLAVWSINGHSAYQDSVEKLRTKNQEYYDYMSFLLVLEKFIESRVISADALINDLIVLALMSLTIDFTKIPEENHISKDVFIKYINTPSISKNFDPSRKFWALINSYVKTIEKYGNDSEELNNSILSLHQFKVILDEEYMIRLNAKIKFLYKSSTKKNEINKKLDKLKLTTNLPGYLAVYPTNLNIQQKMENSVKEAFEFNKRFDIFCRTKTLGIYVLLFSRNFISKYFPLTYQGYIPNEIFGTYFIEEDLEKMHNNVFRSNIPLILLGNKDLISKYVRNHLRSYKGRIFIFIDLALIYNIDFINGIFSNSNFRIIEYDVFSLLVINKKNLFLLQVISKNALKDIFKLIQKNELNIQQIFSNSDGFDKEIIKNKSDSDEFDLIINTFLA